MAAAQAWCFTLSLARAMSSGGNNALAVFGSAAEAAESAEEGRGTGEETRGIRGRSGARRDSRTSGPPRFALGLVKDPFRGSTCYFNCRSSHAYTSCLVVSLIACLPGRSTLTNLMSGAFVQFPDEAGCFAGVVGAARFGKIWSASGGVLIQRAGSDQAQDVIQSQCGRRPVGNIGRSFGM